MGILIDTLTAPVFGPLRGVGWLAAAIAAEADRARFDEKGLRQALMELELSLDLGEISEAEYEAVEAELLARLAAVRDGQEGAEP